MRDPFLADKPDFVLKPCPFCGSSDIQKAARRDFPVATRCRDCGAEGPAKLTGREADTDWNSDRQLERELADAKANITQLKEAGGAMCRQLKDERGTENDWQERAQQAIEGWRKAIL